jgi:hypothetical protein
MRKKTTRIKYRRMKPPRNGRTEILPGVVSQRRHARRDRSKRRCGSLYTCWENPSTATVALLRRSP